MPLFSDSPEHDVYFQVGERIRKARIAAGLTQASLANKISLSRTSVTNIERGRQPVSLHTLYSIASVLKIKIADLLPDNKDGPDAIARINIPENLDPHEQAWIETLISGGKAQN